MEITSTLITSGSLSSNGVHSRQVKIPPHRYKPLKKAWREIYDVVYHQMKTDIQMNLKTRKVELMTRSDESEINLQKCVNFINAFALGFDVVDATRILLQPDDVEVFTSSYCIKDFSNRSLRGHLLGRFMGKCIEQKADIEKSTKTRIVIEDPKINILGRFHEIQAATNTFCNVTLELPTGNVDSNSKFIAYCF